MPNRRLTALGGVALPTGQPMLYWGGGGAGMHWKGGGYPPPSGAPSLCPATVPLTPASMAFVTDSNRPSTASATSSNRLSKRLWGLL